MFEDLLESLRLEESIARKLHVLHESMTWEQIALALYQLLDDIDTADDIAKESDKTYRGIVQKTQAEKNKYLRSPDGYEVEPVVDIAPHETDKAEPPKSDLTKVMTETPETDGDDDEVVCSLMKYNVTEAVAVRTNPEKQMQDYYKKIINTKLVKSNYPGERDDFKFWLLTNGNVIPVKHSHIDTSDDAGIGHKELMDAGSFIGRIHGWELNLTSSRNHKFTAKQISRLKDIQIEYKITKLLVVAEDVFSADIKSPKELSYYLEYGKEEWESIKEPVESKKVEEEIKRRGLNENLEGHAQKELKLAGLFDKDSDYDGMLGEAVMELMSTFAKQGHSGMSAMLVRELFSKLVNYEPLTEITDDPDEWQAVSEYYGGPAEDLVEMEYQCLRNPVLFSSDGGSTYWDVNDTYLSEEQGYDGSMAMWDKRPMYTSKHREKE